MQLTHNNKDYYPDCHVYSDELYDYAIVNGESITRYYGSEPGEYESYPIHMLVNPKAIMEQQPWIMEVILADTGRLYKHHKELIDKIIKFDEDINILKRCLRRAS